MMMKKKVFNKMINGNLMNNYLLIKKTLSFTNIILSLTNNLKKEHLNYCIDCNRDYLLIYMSITSLKLISTAETRTNLM